MQLADLIRYGLWCVLAATADANCREYNMATAWLPHLLTNSLSLLLPDILRIIAPHAASHPSSDTEVGLVQGTLDIAQASLIRMARDNPNYVIYVTPLALGYILSHPRFDIYKGKLGAIRVAGFGLDALPHSATAMGLSALASDTAQSAAQTVPSNNPWTPLVRWAGDHPSAFSALVLALATLVWESGEYRVYRHELRLRGDPALINMQWSLVDTLRDIAANTAGWLAATYFLPQLRRKTRQTTKGHTPHEQSRLDTGYRPS